jgi:hypothetical protein
MDDLFSKIVADRGSVESVMSRLPGFRGYMEMSARREADRMIRDHVAKQYDIQINRFAGIESNLVRQGGLMHMDRSKSIRTRMDNLRRRIATDVPGYSGFFASSKIGPEELQNVYAFDEAMLRYADQISKDLDALENSVNSGEGVDAVFGQLDRTVNEAAQAYDLRDDVLKGIG